MQRNFNGTTSFAVRVVTSCDALSLMGAFHTAIRNPDDDYSKTLVSISSPIGQSFSNSIPSPIDHISEAQRLLFFKSKQILSRISSCADSKSRYFRETHAPVRRSGFDSVSRTKRPVSFASFELNPAEKMGNCIGIPLNKLRNGAGKCFEFLGNGREHDADRENSGENEDDFIDFRSVDSEERKRLKMAEEESPSFASPVVTGVSYADALGMPAHKKLYDESKRRDGKLRSLGLDIEYNEKHSQWLRLRRPQKKDKQIKNDAVDECFVPLSEEEEALVDRALSVSYRSHILVSHDNSNIDITGAILQCLKPLTWLNDEVINLYLELLKERENREPQKFLKCHFFNTFFYKKLISGRDGYNFQAVRRWTTQRKLGYNLLDCEKIFVPIHKNSHWCLAIINKKDTKLQYLDSLKVDDSQLRQVMNVLARYYADEVKDRTGKDFTVNSWEKEFVINCPQQENMSDCGMFMIKYVDFHSRDIGLYFDQRHMPYFRLRTAKELLKLRAG